MISLAYLELYIGIGSIFRNFDQLRVDNFGPKDLEFDDYFGPFFRPTQNKFHVALDVWAVGSMRFRSSLADKYDAVHAYELVLVCWYNQRR